MLYNPDKLLLIAGPCALENEAIAHTVAKFLSEIQRAHTDLTIVFKTSFDKANRMAIHSKRGIGMKEGLRILKDIRQTYQLPVITDVHQPEQASAAAEVCDALQIPAFLCRQTDLLVAAARCNKTVNVKKGQFLAPQDMRFVVEKLQSQGAQEVWQTERGTTFGYHNLVVDMRSFDIMHQNGAPVIFDATHSVQLPGGGKGESSGERHYIPILARSALAAGAQGIYCETHPNPAEAISDAACQIPLQAFIEFVKGCLSLWKHLKAAK